MTEKCQKKLFVVLEQGNKRNTLLSKEHRNQFSTDYCDWFRLNWKGDKNDNEAQFFDKNIKWSEGRSILFEKVKGKYQYYIFIDDDVKFISKTNKSVAEEIKYFFQEYKPLTGTFYGNNWAIDYTKIQIDTDKKEVCPVAHHDLASHYFKEDFAELMFPVYFHGSGRTMWYSQFIGYKFYPNKCLVFNNIIANNTQHEQPRNWDLEHNVVIKFSEIIKDENIKKEFLKWHTGEEGGRSLNKKIYSNEISKDEFIFDKSKLKNLILLDSVHKDEEKEK